MTNFQAWQLYFRDIPTAQSYIDWSWYFLVGAALQRRVWLSGNENAIYPNQYVILTGSPGTGKSLMLNPVKAFLAEQKYVRELKVGGANARMVEILRFPVAADSTTFQSLVEETCEAVSVHDLDSGPVMHHSISFILDELASIFKQESEDLTTFLLTVHGCHAYRRRIRDTSGRFTIDKPCVGIIAGTVIAKLRGLLGSGILDTGMTARCIFVYAQKPRFREALIPSRDNEQNLARLQIANHLKKLHQAYGEINYTPDALKFIRNWWKDIDRVKVNSDPCLDFYYERKALHLNKICIALLFAEQTDSYVIDQDILEQGIAILNANEVNMHVPLSGGRRNVLFTIGVDIIEYISKHESVTEVELMAEFLAEANQAELVEILQTLQKQNEITISQESGLYVYKLTNQTNRPRTQDQDRQVNIG